MSIQPIGAVNPQAAVKPSEAIPFQQTVAINPPRQAVQTKMPYMQQTNDSINNAEKNGVIIPGVEYQKKDETTGIKYNDRHKRNYYFHDKTNEDICLKVQISKLNDKSRNFVIYDAAKGKRGIPLYDCTIDLFGNVRIISGNKGVKTKGHFIINKKLEDICLITETNQKIPLKELFQNKKYENKKNEPHIDYFLHLLHIPFY